MCSKEELFIDMPCESNINTVVKEHPQLTFTCSKSKIEALEKGVKYVQS